MLLLLLIEKVSCFLLFSDEHRKKEVRITLLPEDIHKLSYLITLTDERSRRDGEPFSVDHHVKRFMRKKMPKVTYTDIHVYMYIHTYIHINNFILECDDVMMM